MGKMHLLLLGFLLSFQAFAALPTIRCGGDDTSSLYLSMFQFEEGVDDFIFTVRESNVPHSFVSHLKSPVDRQMYTMEFRIPKLTRAAGQPPVPNCFFTQTNGLLFNCSKGAVVGRMKLTSPTGVVHAVKISQLNVRATETSRTMLSSMDQTTTRKTVDVLFDGKTSLGEGKSILSFERTVCSFGEPRSIGARRLFRGWQDEEQD